MRQNISLRTNLVETIRHSLVLGLGWIVATAIRLSLLPVFTRHLDTTEYGTVAFLDSAVGLARIILVAGITSAVLRFFNQESDENYKKAVVSTATQVLLSVELVAGFLLVLTAESIGFALLGSHGKSSFVLLAGGQMLVGFSRFSAESLLVATRRSRVISIIVAVQALFSAAANVYLVIVADLGVFGLLMGNFLVSAVFSVGFTIWTFSKVGWRFEKKLLREMLRFGLPMVPALIAASAMHEADRLFIRAFSSMEEVGIYSIAYSFPFMLSSILTQNFESVWGGSIMYEIHRAPDATYQLRRMCTYTMLVLGMALFGTAVGARSIVSLFTGPAFHRASEYIAPIALGVWIYALHMFVRTGVVLTKRTYLFPINYGIACAINLILNFILVPIYGAMAAAWVSVITYSWFSIGGFFLYRRCYVLDIEWARLCRFLAACVVATIVRGIIPSTGFWPTLAIDVAFFVLVPIALFLLPKFLTAGERAFAIELLLRILPEFARVKDSRGNV